MIYGFLADSFQSSFFLQQQFSFFSIYSLSLVIISLDRFHIEVIKSEIKVYLRLEFDFYNFEPCYFLCPYGLDVIF